MTSKELKEWLFKTQAGQNFLLNEKLKFASLFGAEQKKILLAQKVLK